MSIKIDLYYLFKDKKSLLGIDAILNKKGILFNAYNNGEYSYWLEGPIWKYGESENYILDSQNKKLSSQDILRSIEDYYSPMIKYGLSMYGQTYMVQLAAIETEWADMFEVCLSLDYSFLVDRDSKEIDKAYSFLIDLFCAISKEQGCYWGIAGLEIAGFQGLKPYEWDKINSKNFYDLTYLSKEAREKESLNLNALRLQYEIIEFADKSIFVKKKNMIFNLES